MPIVQSRVTSQGGQDGTLASIFSAIGETNRFYVEFGFNAVEFSGGSGANSYQLKLRGWSGVLLDGENENPAIRLYAHRVTPEIIVGIFERYGVPHDLDYLSVDIDSIDFWIVRALLLGGFRPRVFSIEYNGNFHSSSCVVPRRRAPLVYPHTQLYGASLGALEALAKEFGNGIVDVVSLLDVFMVRCDIMASPSRNRPFSPVSPSQFPWPHTCQRCHLHLRPENRHDFTDFCVWLQTGGDDMTAEEAAYEQVKNARDSDHTSTILNQTVLECVSFGF